ncbi:hypothetical protein C4J81_09570 [Deltaproteobacteria bacterium Smac51]|nr:hypothetical protein C4J81_09570 [Deltaproteobacteria bacterium Smac51]
MAKSLKHIRRGAGASRTLLRGVPAALALMGLLGVSPAALAQDLADHDADDIVSSIFMEAGEGTVTDNRPPQTAATGSPPLPPSGTKKAGKPPTHTQPSVQAKPPAATEQPSAQAEPPVSAEPSFAPVEDVEQAAPAEQSASAEPPVQIKTAGKPPKRTVPPPAEMPTAVLEQDTQPPGTTVAQDTSTPITSPRPLPTTGEPPVQTAGLAPEDTAAPITSPRTLPTAELIPEDTSAPITSPRPLPGADDQPGQSAVPLPPETLPSASQGDERPLPVPPGAAARATELIDEDDFLSPEQLTADNEAEANSLTLPINLGALPSLQWETTDPNAPTARFISDSPLPQFDSSQSNWKQLEVGQADTSSVPPVSQEKPSSVSSVGEPAATAAPPASPATDREHLRNLFNDMLPPPGQGARPSGQPLQLNLPPADDTAGETPGGTATPVQTAKVETKTETIPDEPLDIEVLEIEEDEGGSAILRAGGQLTVDGHFGEAAILPPLDEAPDLAIWQEARKADGKKAEQVPAKGESTASGQKDKRPAKNAPTASGSSKKSGGAGSQTSRTTQKPPAAVVRSQLTLINETGNDRMLEIYRSVLSQMGYTIVSVETRAPVAAPTGQTVISYRPGLKAKAQAVASHLPGRKVLVESPGGLSTDISILLR